MSKKIISIIFSGVLLLLLTAPTILTLVDDSIDSSVIFSLSEEEGKGSEKNINIELIFESIESNYFQLVFLTEEDSLEYFYKKYTLPYLNKVSPPPDLHFL